MEEINLLQTRIRDTNQAWERQTRLAISALAVILILLVGFWAVFFFLNNNTQNQLAQALTQGQDLQNQLNQKQAGISDAKAYQAQLTNFQSLLATHQALSPLLAELSNQTYKQAEFTKFSVDNSTGAVHLEGQVSSYNDLAKLLLGLSTSQKFQNVTLASVAPSTGKNAAFLFAIDLTVNPSFLTQQ